jgi:hypothetical protein
LASRVEGQAAVPANVKRDSVTRRVKVILRNLV